MTKLVKSVAALLGFAAVVFAAASADEASAATPVSHFTLTPSTSQAGGHPDLITDMDFVNQSQLPPVPCNCNILKEFTISSPAGLVGSPTTTPRCSQAEFAAYKCPADAQIGVSVASLGTRPEDQGQYWIQPLYNMIPRPEELALWATYLPFTAAPSIFTSISTRTDSDYGLDLRTVGIPMLGTPPELTILTWGIPADPVHDDLRFRPAPGIEEGWSYSIGCNPALGSPLPDLLEGRFPEEKCPEQKVWGPIAANFPPVPYFSNPTTCVGPLTASIETLAYDQETFRRDTGYPAITGCDQLSFDPSLTGKPTTTAADSPSGIDVDIRVPQTLSPTTASPSQIRGVTVNLPEGFTINPNAADGKLACADAEARFGTREEAHCPEYAKVGTLGIESAALPRILPGALYLGKPLPGNRYRVFLTADGFSVHVKLPGTAVPDPATGRLRLLFEDLPQTPFERFKLHIFGAERGLLATPTQCGTYPVRAEFEPWASELPVQTSTQFFTIDSGPGGAPCPPAIRPFAPGLNTGITDNTGGHHTDFVFDLTREDGQQEISTADVVMPSGFTASLRGIPYCPEATLAALAASSYGGRTELAAPACPASLVGRSLASAGAGSRPVALGGSVYLAGPYRGSQLSLAVVTPAVSGPYDLGNVVVRIALRVDPVTARVSAASDPFPKIIEGIPVRLRRVMLNLDRPRFVLNPTNCDPFSIRSAVRGDQGAFSDLETHFQVANCGALAFKPRLGLKLQGSVKRRGHPAIRAVLRTKPGESALRRIRVTLPRGELLDSSHIDTVCTRVSFAARTCPEGSRLGWAEAHTPLLDEPLRGPVYLRASSNRLPDIVAALHGQIDFEVSGRVDSVRGSLRTNFESIPDVPVSRFTLNLVGGRKGLLINSNDLCARSRSAKVLTVGHNGRRSKSRAKLQVGCGKKSSKRAARRGANR